MAKVNLIANESGMISIDGVPYQKGTLKPRPFGTYARMMIEDNKGFPIVAARVYGDYQNNGVDFASASALKTFVEENFFFDGGGGGGSIVYEELDGTELDGFQYVDPSTGNMSFTVAEGASGILRILNGASHTLEIFEVGVEINDSATNNGLTVIPYYTIEALGVIGLEDANGRYVEIPIPAPDVTAPEPTSATIENAAPADVVIDFDEALDAGNVPDAGDFTSLLGKTFTPAIVGGNLVLTANSAYVNGEVEQITYTPGTTKLQDAEGNEVAAFDTDDFGGVDNNIAPASDADVDAWATASGVTDPTIISSLTTFAQSLKSASIFSTHFDYIRLYVGGDAAKSKLNLINPTDSDGAYRATFINTPTFASTGVTLNGTNQYINGHWIGGASAKATDTDYHIAAYSRSSAAHTGYIFGVKENANTANIWLCPRFTNDNLYSQQLNQTQTNVANANGSGLFLLENTGATANSKKTSRNTTLLIDADDGGNAHTLPDTYFLATGAYNDNTTISEYRACELVLESAGKSFTAPQRAAYQAAVAQLITDLGI